MILEKLNEEIVRCMKAKESFRLNALKMVKTELTNNLKEAQPKPELDVVMAYRKKLAKSLEMFQSKPEAMETLKKEIAIVDEYLPKTASKADIEAIVAKHIQLKDFGQIMKAVRAEIQGPFDGKLVGEIVKSKLG